jgi:hypothetical protein
MSLQCHQSFFARGFGWIYAGWMPYRARCIIALGWLCRRVHARPTISRERCWVAAAMLEVVRPTLYCETVPTARRSGSPKTTCFPYCYPSSGMTVHMAPIILASMREPCKENLVFYLIGGLGRLYSSFPPKYLYTTEKSLPLHPSCLSASS